MLLFLSSCAARCYLQDFTGLQGQSVENIWIQEILQRRVSAIHIVTTEGRVNGSMNSLSFTCGLTIFIEHISTGLNTAEQEVNVVLWGDVNFLRTSLTCANWLSNIETQISCTAGSKSLHSQMSPCFSVLWCSSEAELTGARCRRSLLHLRSAGTYRGGE